MRKTLATSLTVVMAAILLTLGAGGCTFNPKVSFRPTRTYQCPGTVVRYGRATPTSPPAGSVEDQSGTALQFSSLALNQPLYPDKSWCPGAIPAPLKGAYLVRIRYSDRTAHATNEDTDWFLRLWLYGRSVDRFWIAFDDRAASPPSWLTKDFKKVTPAVFLSSTQSYFAGGQVKRVRYQLWEPKAGFADYIEGGIRTLGGNNAKGVAWKTGTTGSQYLVVLRMRPRPDTSTRLEALGLATLKVVSRVPPRETSETWLNSAKALAMEKWLKKPEHAKYRQAYRDGLVGLEVSTNSCSEITSGTGSTGRPLRALQEGNDPEMLGSWVRASEGEFDPSSSTITVTMSGHAPVTTHVAGTIAFDIGRDNTASIENINLWGNDLILGNGVTVRDLSVTQRRSFLALCADGLPHFPGRLCGRYEVPVDAENGLSAEAVVSVGGSDVVLLLQNSSPLTLDVDLNTMEFSFSGGPLTGTLEVNGQSYTVDVSVALEGALTNLAPVADISETAAEWECGDTGLAQVLLSATSSTDELDPTDITGFDWYEDRGALTQRHLGSGSTLSTPLVFGSHDLTLKVTDAHGSYSTTDFVVDVVDSRIDSIQPPPDRWVVVADPAGTPVQIGTAGASDVCSGVVEIENDAPASGLFPLGFTPVTWVFDDTHGNLVRHVQRVFVVDQAFFPPPVSEIEISVPEVSPGQSVSIVHRTWPQGKGMLLDEYVLIRDGAGGIWSIDSSGGIAPGVVPRATWNNLGASATTATVFSGAIDPYLPGPGFYTVEAVLVVPGGDPLDASEIVGWSRSELEIVR
jgi:hypothetical protein